MLFFSAMRSFASRSLFRGGGRKYSDMELLELLKDERRPILVAVDESDRVLGYAFCICQTSQGNPAMREIGRAHV